MNITDHYLRYRLLKRADLCVQQRGRNTELGKPAEWSNHCRSGARWNAYENEHLMRMVRERADPTLYAVQIAELAWELGRTANAVCDQLYKIMPKKEFFSKINPYVFDTP